MGHGEAIPSGTVPRASDGAPGQPGRGSGMMAAGARGRPVGAPRGRCETTDGRLAAPPNQEGR
jgi:hypothetical protein